LNDNNDLVAHMRHVQAAESDLRELGLVWQMIESSASISCPEAVAPILPTLVATRERFADLQRRLVKGLAQESEEELADELRANAQSLIDILVRNLFERTADVGFLAADEDVRRYCAAALKGEGDLASIRERLTEYQAKYTVYDDILLVAADGRVLARLDAAPGTRDTTSDPIVAAALAHHGYVEQFAVSDLGGDTRPTLLYAHRIRDAAQHHSAVLVLRFRLADELQRIFQQGGADRSQAAMLLIDADNRVIASNDEDHVPLGVRVRTDRSDRLSLTTFAGKDYLAVNCGSDGYQGYGGPAWRAVAMVSLLTAFRGRNDHRDADLSGSLANPELATINADAIAINRDLRRAVWNGRLMARNIETDRSRLQAVLTQVSQAGLRTRHRVDAAIRELHVTARVRMQKQVGELARMASDILDRNLYERANDCRWWALSPTLRQGLSDGSATGSALAAVLDHINSLYTVYTRLVVFDTRGQVRALSRADQGGAAWPTSVPEAWVRAVNGLASTQTYAVSPFEDTAFHTEGETYTYMAAIRAPGSMQIVGGIAAIFNSRAELAAMLRDVMGDREGYAAFVDHTGQVLAITSEAARAHAVAAHAARQPVVSVGDEQHACAAVEAAGYREFKCSDGYDNHVTAVVGLQLTPADRRRLSLTDVDLVDSSRLSSEARTEIAVFNVGAARLALPVDAIVLAVPTDGLVRTPTEDALVVGMVAAPLHHGNHLVRVFCARRLTGVLTPARATDGVILILRDPRDPKRAALGLRVDDVLAVLELSADRMHAPPTHESSRAGFLSALADCEARGPANDGRALIQCLDAARLVDQLLRRPAAHDTTARTPNPPETSPSVATLGFNA